MSSTSKEVIRLLPDLIGVFFLLPDLIGVFYVKFIKRTYLAGGAEREEEGGERVPREEHRPQIRAPARYRVCRSRRCTRTRILPVKNRILPVKKKEFYP